MKKRVFGVIAVIVIIAILLAVMFLTGSLDSDKFEGFNIVDRLVYTGKVITGMDVGCTCPPGIECMEFYCDITGTGNCIGVPIREGRSCTLIGGIGICRAGSCIPNGLLSGGCTPPCPECFECINPTGYHCAPIPGCTTTCTSDAQCNDNNACNGVERCVSGTCGPGVSLNCNDNNACTTDSCDSQTGCVNTQTNCNDGNPCTTDSCNSQTGCVNAPISGPGCGSCTSSAECNDNDQCTADACTGGQCFHDYDENQPGCGGDTDPCANVNCNDGDFCTIDSCSGGVCTNNQKSCPDGETCSSSKEKCEKPQECSDEKKCDDDFLCTIDSCVNGECTNTFIDCPDGQACEKGQCVYKQTPCLKICSDGTIAKGVTVGGNCIAECKPEIDCPTFQELVFSCSCNSPTDPEGSLFDKLKSTSGNILLALGVNDKTVNNNIAETECKRTAEVPLACAGQYGNEGELPGTGGSSVAGTGAAVTGFALQECILLCNGKPTDTGLNSDTRQCNPCPQVNQDNNNQNNQEDNQDSSDTATIEIKVDFCDELQTCDDTTDCQEGQGCSPEGICVNCDEDHVDLGTCECESTSEEGSFGNILDSSILFLGGEVENQVCYIETTPVDESCDGNGGGGDSSSGICTQEQHQQGCTDRTEVIGDEVFYSCDCQPNTGVTGAAITGFLSSLPSCTLLCNGEPTDTGFNPYTMQCNPCPPQVNQNQENNNNNNNNNEKQIPSCENACNHDEQCEEGQRCDKETRQCINPCESSSECGANEACINNQCKVGTGGGVETGGGCVDRSDCYPDDGYNPCANYRCNKGVCEISYKDGCTYCKDSDTEMDNMFNPKDFLTSGSSSLTTYGVPERDEIECNSDSDCPNGKLCHYNNCLPECTPSCSVFYSDMATSMCIDRVCRNCPSSTKEICPECIVTQTATGPVNSCPGGKCVNNKCVQLTQNGVTKQDYCELDESGQETGYLFEYYCKNEDEIGEEKTLCEIGCENGACIRCKDSDDALMFGYHPKSFFTKGHTTDYSGSVSEDYCDPFNQILFETYCGADEGDSFMKPMTIYKPCSELGRYTYCGDGACIQEAVCKSDDECNDYIGCTVDKCNIDSCSHTLDNALCSNTQYCEKNIGCVERQRCTSDPGCTNPNYPYCINKICRQCRNNNNCLAGQVCENNVCVLECTTDSDCNNDNNVCNGIEQCINNKCKLIFIEPPPCVAPLFTCITENCDPIDGWNCNYRDDSRCPQGQVCNPDSPNADETTGCSSTCTTDKQCQDVYRSCYYKCDQGSCVRFNTIVSPGEWPDCGTLCGNGICETGEEETCPEDNCYPRYWCNNNKLCYQIGARSSLRCEDCVGTCVEIDNTQAECRDGLCGNGICETGEEETCPEDNCYPRYWCDNNKLCYQQSVSSSLRCEDCVGSCVEIDNNNAECRSTGGCSSCGGTLLDTNICDRQECEGLGLCYFVRNFNWGSCVSCSSASCTNYNGDQQSCRDDVCGLGNCEWDGGSCREICDPYNPCTNIGMRDVIKECGFWDNGCGTNVNCGTCDVGESCNNLGQCVIEGCTDSDNDGHEGKTANCLQGTDCNDNDANTYPGATEICDNNRDEDCNGIIDDGDICINTILLGEINESKSAQLRERGIGSNNVELFDFAKFRKYGELHTLKIKQKKGITNGVKIQITSQPQNFEIAVGETINIDLDEDEVYDIWAKLDLIDDANGKLKFTLGPYDNDGDGFFVPEDCDDEDPEVNPDAEELCDEIDNNCDNSVDEGCSGCISDDIKECGSNVGECEKGLQICNNGVWGECDGDLTLTAEECDDMDNDCDGLTDEDDVCVGESCTSGDIQECGVNIGECMIGIQECVDGFWESCFGDIEPENEYCDELDNDCDGLVDEGDVCSDKFDWDDFEDEELPTVGIGEETPEEIQTRNARLLALIILGLVLSGILLSSLYLLYRHFRKGKEKKIKLPAKKNMLKKFLRI